ncbi:EAL domain-containing protein [uncultured Alteromonas sp.]|uniref:putative bifunctional diguanylate cyclase/phosphodiesterase n=1 Tax=uncultured Alteromonas sp. TaxID=179113 RepID=UPI0030CD3FB3
MNVRKTRSLTAFWYWLSRFWTDPDATSELANYYRARQIDSLSRQLPLASSATVLIVILCSFFANGLINSDFMIAWSLSLLIIAAGDVIAWYLLVKRKIENTGSKRVQFLLALMLGLAAVLYAQMTTVLLGVLDTQGKIILVAILAAFIATGAWQFASLPAAALFWVLFLTLGVSVGIHISYLGEYLFISALLLIYWIYLSCVVLVTSKRFIRGLVAETAIEHQRQVVGLLLKDFEENASDWLWEIDSHGCLKHVSLRMQHVLGKPVHQLSGSHFVNLLSDSTSAANQNVLRELATNFQQNEPFTQDNIPIEVNGDTKWWSLTAQPLINSTGNLSGWRGVSTDVTDALLREKEMTFLANIDSLTGLANRHLFAKTLHECFADDAEDGTKTPEIIKDITLITLDLDNFKVINDTLGHLAGDALLKDISCRFKEITPKGVLLSRLGGDEFAWVFKNSLTPLEATRFGQKIHELLAEPWLHQEHSFDLGASIGVANAPMDGVSPVSLQRASDMALYAAKASGKNKLCFYDPKLDEYAMLRLALLSDFRQSFADGDFVVLYQPQIRFSDNTLIGFEALVRWHHPERGVVSPTDFIHLIEENGMIVQLGEWVLRQACSDAMNWPAPLQVAVNVSPVQIERTNLLTTVIKALKATSLPASRLELELTESSLMCDGDSTIMLLNSLREQGVRIALDDFGTGYSSLSYLQRFPFDKLKVDRSFVIASSENVQNVNSANAESILSAILQLANALHLQTTAEGVETQDVSTLLQKLGFTNAQGFFYGRPMTAEHAENFISQWPDIQNKEN